MRVAIIGGGPSGLVTLKYLKTAHEFFPDTKPIRAKLFDAEEEIGGSFRYRSYEGAELESSRQLITFSDFRYPPGFADFLSPEEYCQYLEGYVRRFELQDLIHLSTRVTNIDRSIRGGHIINYIENGVASKWACDAVAICSGLHAIPKIPSIQGIEHVPLVLHSSEFKDKTQFGVGKNVLILGSGESAMDIALALAASPGTGSVFLSYDDNISSKEQCFLDPLLVGLKLKVHALINVLHKFGSSHVLDFNYPILRGSPVLRHYCDAFPSRFLAPLSGPKASLEKWIGCLLSKLDPIFPTRSMKTTSCLRNLYQPSSFSRCPQPKTIQNPISAGDGRRIRILPWPKQFLAGGILDLPDCDRSEVSGREKERRKVDVVIFDTGYDQDFTFLSPFYPLPQHAKIRSIWKNNDETVGFIGFVRSSLGAIPPISEMQAQLWVLNLLKLLPTPVEDREDICRLPLPAKNPSSFDVDHNSYVNRLALDMGSAPSLSEILQKGGPKLAFIWALTMNVNSKYRLVGPWKWSEAKRVMDTEMRGPTTRRPILSGNYSIFDHI